MSAHKGLIVGMVALILAIIAGRVGAEPDGFIAAVALGFVSGGLVGWLVVRGDRNQGHG